MGHRAPSVWHNLQRGNTSLRKSQFLTQPYVIITPFSLVWCTYWEHDCAAAATPAAATAQAIPVVAEPAAEAATPAGTGAAPTDTNTAANPATTVDSKITISGRN